jgi:hypothetical protein
VFQVQETVVGLVPVVVQPAYAVHVVAPTARCSTTNVAGSIEERASVAVAVTVTVPCTTAGSAATVTLGGVQSFAAMTASAVVVVRLQVAPDQPTPKSALPVRSIAPTTATTRWRTAQPPTSGRREEGVRVWAGAGRRRRPWTSWCSAPRKMSPAGTLITAIRTVRSARARKA